MTVIREYNTNQEIKRLKDLMNKETDPVKKAETLEKIRLVKIGSEIQWLMKLNPSKKENKIY